jgi:hypothetical protein
MPFRKLNPGERFIHDPITFTYPEGKVTIKENGRVCIQRDVSDKDYDEVEVPASLILKIGRMLRDTRKVVNAGTTDRNNERT